MILGTTLNSHLIAALGYVGRGWHVFPLRAGTKGRDAQGNSTHLLMNGHNGASNDPAAIQKWWAKWPNANIGLNLKASGLVALDFDTYKKDCERASYVHGRDLPNTLVQSSAHGGKHYIFLAEPGVEYASLLCPGVEIKHRGYILLEPSTFETGVYRFENDDEPVAAPAWLPKRGTSYGGKGNGQSGSGNPHFDFSSSSSPSSSRPSADVEEVVELLSWIDPDSVGYDAWIEVLQALHHHFNGSAEGLGLADEWSRQGAKYKPGEVAEKWQGFHLDGGVPLKSLASLARANGADLSEISSRHARGGTTKPAEDQTPECPPDLSHDDLALDLGRRSWDRNARHVALWGKWLFWSGTHWQRDETLDHLSRIRTYLRLRATEIVDWADRAGLALADDPDRKRAEKLNNWAREQAKSLRSQSTVAAVANLARANPASSAGHEAFDRDRLLLGTPGGTIDLRSGLLRTARPEEMISHRVTCAPADPGVVPQLWCNFLRDITDGNDDVVRFLQRAAGYALTGSTDEHKLLFFHGSGRNGKSVFLNTLLYLWGDYGRRVAAATFLNSQAERHPTDIAGLHGARLAIASELPRGKTWDEAIIKDLTGGDRMTARFMRQDYFDFDPQLTLMIAGNTQPSFRGVDEAIRSRVVLVPFAVTIPAERRDRRLPEKLIAEGPAILRWCIEGAIEWQLRGLDVPPAIAAASKAYFDEEDTVAQFLEEETLPDPHGIVTTDELVDRFNFWSEGQGLGPWTKRTLVKELKMRGFADAKTNGRRGLRGLRLR